MTVKKLLRLLEKQNKKVYFEILTTTDEYPSFPEANGYMVCNGPINIEALVEAINKEMQRETR